MVKKIGTSDIIGERGVAVIRKIVLDVGFMFYQIGGVEAGIDGYIEIRDPKTGIVSNQILQVQSRATPRPLPGDSETGFHWNCTETEIDYWRRGTAPVLLIIVEPDHNRAYWKSIRDYFDGPEKLASTRIDFDKRNDLLNAASGAKLAMLAESVAPGTPPLADRGIEQLTINLVRVTEVASTIYWAPTDYRSDKSFGIALRETDKDAPSEWIVRSSAVMLFHDLDTHPWQKLCDTGAIEAFDVEEWSDSDDPDRRRQFVELLGRALSQMVQPDLYHDRDQNTYFFRRSRGRDRLSISYPASQNQTTKLVVNRYMKKRNPTETAFWRHSAFRPRFHSFDGDWYLEVTPSYMFTRDGYAKSRFAAENLKKIKEIENNDAVLGQFLMWRHFLCGRSDGDLLREGYPFLRLEPMDPFLLARGLTDELWRSRESKVAPSEASLFDTLP